MMKKLLRWLGIAAGLGLGGLAVLALLWVRPYQALADEEPVVTLVPAVADLTYCTMEGVPLQWDLYFPAPAQVAPAPVLV